MASDTPKTTKTKKTGARRRLPVWPLRRTVQVAFLLSLFALPLIARYSHYLSARQLDKVLERWEGTTQGRLLAGTDAVMRLGVPDGEGGVPERRPRKAILARTRDFYGSPWSMRLFGATFTDLLAGAESVAASHTVRRVLLVGMLPVLVISLVLGRVYCGYVCPMGLLFDLTAKLRTLLRRVLEIRPLGVRIGRANKYIILATGLAVVLLVGAPLLHLVYPPAMLAREAHSLVMGTFDRAEGGAFGLAVVGLTGASVALLGMLLLETFVAPRFFCRSICPGGALYALAGRFRLLRVKRIAPACDACTICDSACPRGLLPMRDQTGGECDNCGVCIDACPTGALKFRVAWTDAPIEKGPRAPVTVGASAGKVGTAVVLLVLAGGLLSPTGVWAHHILGIPHYAYDESYPQAPVLKLLENVGTWEIQLTGYPGNPAPGERSQIHVYMVDARSRVLYPESITMDVFHQPMLGKRERIFSQEKEARENIFQYFLAFPEEGNYEVTLSFEDGPTISSLTIPMVVGDPGSPWATLGGFGGGLLLLILGVRSIRIKRARAERRREIISRNREEARA